MLSPIDAKRLISDDLYNELRWMLVAASEWSVCENGSLSPNTPSHLQVLALDSACVHIRSLYEFFMDDPGKHRRTDTAHASRDFGVSLPPTTLYNDYIDGINKRVFHLDNFRPVPSSRSGSAVNTDVNRKIILLAHDVLNLWDGFAAQLPSYMNELSIARSDSISDAKNAAESLGGKPIFV
jgi:hypothetical protein